MAQTQAFGQITLVDISDIGTLSVQPESNQPLTVVYNPDVSSYTPDWATSNLILKPVIYYAGQQLRQGTTGLTVSWYEKLNTNTTEGYGTQVEGQNFVCSVTNNPFSASTDASSITYTCVVNYQDPNLVDSLISPLQAIGQITFSKLAQSSTIAKCTVTGPSSIKYGADGNIIGSGEITLTAQVNNCRIKNWTWKGLKAQGAWSTEQELEEKGTSLTINLNDSPFNEYSQWQFQVNATHSITNQVLYDIHTIVKLQDGAPGESNIAAILNKEDMWIPANSEGNIDEDFFTNNEIKVLAFLQHGGTNVPTSDYDVNVNNNSPIPVGSVTKAENSDEFCYSFRINKWQIKDGDDSPDTTELILDFKYPSSNPTYTAQKTFNLTKLIAGQDGKTIPRYDIIIDPVVVNYSGTTGEYDPPNVKLTAFKAYANENGDIVTQQLSNKDVDFFINRNNSGTYQIIDEYKDGEESKLNIVHKIEKETSQLLFGIVERDSEISSTTILDSDNLAIVHDGTSSPAVIFGNESENIPTTNDNKILVDTETIIKCNAVIGTQDTQYKINHDNNLAGVVVTPPTPPGNAAWFVEEQEIKITFAKGTEISAGKQAINFTFTLYIPNATGFTTKDIVKTFTFSASQQGNLPPVAQIYPIENGTIIDSSADHDAVVLEGKLMSGPTEITDNVTYTWQYYHIGSGAVGDESGYKTITSGTAGYELLEESGKKLKITRKAVSVYVAIQLIINGEYYAHQSIQDKSDPLQITMHSTIGEKLINGQGYGVLYPRIKIRDIEQDILGDQFLISAGTALPVLTAEDNKYKENDRYYLLASATGKPVLYKVIKNASSVLQWTEDVSDPDLNITGGEPDSSQHFLYEWTFSDKWGNPTTCLNDNNETAEVIKKRFVFIDQNRVNGKTIFNLRVTQI